ncbi:hypothetical protein PoB_000231100 [Plakobranchus ocellatus]|uniref:Secreted protein n=1 Tax=Plakobranchus ocellatus TaxID=259542 RepID=A0AAV3Y0F8_9GAST|nr:hypothetical protein PoB_000231100 [Plakobranchus ocellatus]
MTSDHMMQKLRMAASLVPIVFLLWASGCHGDDQPANHLLLFDTLPDGISSHKAAPFDVRTNYSGPSDPSQWQDPIYHRRPRPPDFEGGFGYCCATQPLHLPPLSLGHRPKNGRKLI